MHRDEIAARLDMLRRTKGYTPVWDDLEWLLECADALAVALENLIAFAPQKREKGSFYDQALHEGKAQVNAYRGTR